MINYVTIGVSDLAKATEFYTKLLEPIGGKLLFDGGRIRFFGTSMAEPMLAICTPYDENAPHPGNGTMFAIAPGTRAKVDELYALALSIGASDDGAPGERVKDFFYGGYVRDPDGNKMVFNYFGK